MRGTSRTRAPHAAKTAFAIAAAVGTAPGSPTPVDGALASPSTRTSIDSGASRNVAMGYVSHEVVVSASGAVRVVRIWCVIDPGLVVNPDGVRNQTEGGIQQSASWALLEELRHKGGRVATTSWDTYPIATFRDAPESIEVLVEGDASAPSTGVGEPGAVPTAAAIANAVFAACGGRVRDVPLHARARAEGDSARVDRPASEDGEVHPRRTDLRRGRAQDVP